MRGLVLENDVTISDFTSQISDKPEVPIATGSFGDVYRCTVESSEGKTEAAVKVFKIDIDHGTTIEKTRKRILRELRVWLRLNHPAIVPLLGIAYIDPLFPALVSRWMSSGTLDTHIRKQANVSTSARGLLVRGVAHGLNYLHLENVVHGDLHPGNILIDDLGNPRLTDFGLATVVEDPELQLSRTTLGFDFDSRWRAPEVIAIDHDDSERPTFKSDIYSFGSVTFFIMSGDEPWKGKKQSQICIGLSKRVTLARPDNILDDHWNLIRKCWSWEPQNRPDSAEVLNEADKCSFIAFFVSFAGPFIQESIRVTSPLLEGTYPSLHQLSPGRLNGHTAQLQPPTAARHICSHLESSTTRPVMIRAMVEANQRRRRHDATHMCNECGQTFAAIFSLRRHLQFHSGIRSFVCSIPGCDQAFFNQLDCKRHEKSRKRHRDLPRLLSVSS